jgi:hypothetical protein
LEEKMFGTLLKLAAENAIPVGVGVVGTLVVEHGVKWTVGAIKGWVGRNVSSAKDDIAKAKTKANNAVSSIKGTDSKP